MVLYKYALDKIILIGLETKKQGKKDGDDDEKKEEHYDESVSQSVSESVPCFNFDAGDPEERNDLSESQPDMMKMLMSRLRRWMASGVPPRNAPIDPKGDPKNWGGVWSPGWC